MKTESPELTFKPMSVSVKLSPCVTSGSLRQRDLSYPPNIRLPVTFGKTEPTCKLYDSDGMNPLWYARGSIFMAVIDFPFWAVQVMFSLRLLNENCFGHYLCNAGTKTVVQLTNPILSV